MIVVFVIGSVTVTASAEWPIGSGTCREYVPHLERTLSNRPNVSSVRVTCADEAFTETQK